MQIPFYDQASAKIRKVLGLDKPQTVPAPTGLATGPGAPVKGHEELGWGGTPVFGGIVLDDYNPDLLGVEAVRTADKMRRTLGQIRAVTKAITLPITSTHWYLEEPKNASAAEKEATELLRENLFGGMVGQSWDALLREGCLGIYGGFRVPEIVWEERAGLIAVRKIASRNPEMVERWIYHPNGELAGYLYSGNRPIGQGLDHWASSTSAQVRIPIPIEKTLHFVYDQENENPQGFGLWRSQYPHWYFVHALYKIIGIGIERNLLGVPVAEMGDEAQVDDKAYVLQQLSFLRAAEGSAFALPKGWKLSWFEASRTPMDALPLIEHHLRQAALAGLCQFLNLGMSSAGTQSLGTVHAQLFEQSEDGAAKWIRETFEDQLIRRWVLLNYGPKFRGPRLRHKPIKSRDLGAWATALSTLTTSGFIHSTVDDEEKLRAEFALPEIPREQLEQMEEERKAAQEEERQAQRERLVLPNGKPQDKTVKSGDPCGGHTFAEQDAEQLRAARDGQEQEFSERATQLLQSLEAGYLQKLRPLVEAVETAPAVSQGVPISQLADVEIPGARKYEDFVRGFLWRVFNEGRQALAGETGQDVESRAIPNRTRTWVAARASVIAADHVAQLRTAVLSRILTGIRAELPSAQIFSDAGATAIAELSRNAVDDWTGAAAEVMERIAEELP